MKCEKWLTLAAQIILMAVGFAAAYAFLMWLSADSAGAVALSMVPYYLVMGCALFVMVIGIAAYKSYLPVCVSFGSTRRDAMFGLQIMSRLPAMAVTLIAAAFCMIVKNEMTRGFMALWLPLFCLMLAAGSLGGIIGCIGVRFGRIGMLLSVIILMLCGMTGGFVGGVTAAGGFAGVSAFLADFDISTVVTLVAAIVAVVLWAVELIIMKKILGKYEVKL